MNGHTIASVAELEAVLGKTPPPMHLKVIDHLDDGALRWIGRSPLMFAGLSETPAIGVTLAGGPPGFASGDAAELHVPLAAVDDPQLVQPNAAFGSLFLLPGVGETLRVNGRVSGIAADHLRVTVHECYGHCAKALIRSALWHATPLTSTDDVHAFVAATCFAALATIGANGAADLSPKGDPAGCMTQLDGDTLWFADRPGNRRLDSFRNIVDQPEVALALLVPGATEVAIARGRARLTTDEAARARFTVQGKVPLVAVGVELASLELRPSEALHRAALWPVQPTGDIDPANLFVEHIKLNKTAGVAAKLARASMSVPGMAEVLKSSLDKDYRENLY